LNTLLQEIVAGYLERIDDEDLGMVTVTGVEVDNDLNKAQVFISTMEPIENQDAEATYLEALGEYRKSLQGEIARQTRLRKTPEVVFAFDPGVRAGARIEQILSGLDIPPDTEAGE
jgi:ribosome-binding factor A